MVSFGTGEAVMPREQAAALFDFDRRPSFETGGGTPAIGSDAYLLNRPGHAHYDRAAWEAAKASGIAPLHVSEQDETDANRKEFLSGAHALGLIGRQKTLKPQQYRVADTLNLGRMFNAILEPRRSAKTSSLFAWMIGRCLEREDYWAAFTVCTTGVKARDRFRKDIVPSLERVFPDKESRPFHIRKAGGTERLEFKNGSVFQVLPPFGDAFRSDAFDLILFDEGGEATPEMGEDLMAGALATQDTRPDAQLVVAGTAAVYRKGNILWDTLEDGRAGDENTAILEYAAPDTTTDDDLMTDGQKDWAKVEPIVLAAHPGIGHLTTIETVKTRFTKLSLEQFCLEYLSIFGTEGTSSGIVDMTKWEDHAQRGKLPEPPARFGLAGAVHPQQTSACYVAAWRVRGRVKLLVLEHKPGTKWWAAKGKEISLKYRTPIAHDTNGPVTAEVEILERMRPKPRTLPQNFPQIKTAAALLIKEINNDNVDHWDQDELTTAAQLAVKRSVGPNAWALGRKDLSDDITTLEAAAMALREYDAMTKSKPAGPVVAA